MVGFQMVWVVLISLVSVGYAGNEASPETLIETKFIATEVTQAQADEYRSLVLEINKRAHGLQLPRKVTIDIFTRSDKAMFVASQDRVIAPFALVTKSDSPITKESIRFGKIVTAHEYGHSLFEANIGTLFPERSRQNIEFNRIIGAYNELFADVVSVVYHRDLSAIAKAQRWMGKKGNLLRDFMPSGFDAATIGKDSTEVLNPIRHSLGGHLNVAEDTQIHTVAQLIAEELESLNGLNLELQSDLGINQRFEERLQNFYSK